MTLLAQSNRDIREAEQRVMRLDPSEQPFAPGIFDGFFGGVGSGGYSALAGSNYAAGLAVNAAAGWPAAKIDELFGTDFYDSLQGEVESARLAAGQAVPNPHSVGFAGQIVHSVVGIGVPVALGALAGGPVGAAAVGGAVGGAGEFARLTEEGVDPGTAQQAAAVTGLFTAAGVFAPASIGANLWRNVAIYGPAINVSQGIAQQQAVGKVLADQGYTDMAERYSTITAESVIADAVLGSFFAGIGARASQIDVDAAMVIKDQANAVMDVAPGPAVSPKAAQAHVDALAQAGQELDAGRPVTASTSPADFVPAAKPRMVYRDGKWDIRPAVDSTLADEITGLRQVFESAGLKSVVREIDSLQRELDRRGLQGARETDALDALEPDADAIATRPVGEADPDIVARQNASPETVAARVAEESPGTMIAGDDGPVRAGDALRKVDEEIAVAKTEAKAYDVAVQCFLRGGA